jgi:anti-sigma factor RsiW
MSEPFDDATMEQLNAYLDGELEQDARLAFEQRLAREPSLLALLRRMEALGAELSVGLGTPLLPPPSDNLLAAVRGFAAAQTIETPAQPATVVAFPGRQKPVQTAGNGWRIPIAAAIALFAGAGAVLLLQTPSGPTVQLAAVAVRDGLVVETSTLHSVLERTESGAVIAIADETVRPILTFAAKDGRYCREFEAFGAKGSVVGVACKEDRGWKMEVMLAAAPHRPDETQYAPGTMKKL